MNKDDFVNLVSKDLSVNPDKVICGTISYRKLLEAIFEGGTIPKVAEILKIQHRSVNTLLTDTAFPMVDKAYAKPWRTRLLERIGYKTCRICKEIKPLEGFYNKTNHGIKNRSDKSPICKVCDKVVTREKYKKSPHIHRAANNKNKALNINPHSMANANENLIKKIYKECPEGYTVDHMIPLARGGLHHKITCVTYLLE